MAMARTYAPMITFPIAVVAGVIGYNLEWTIRKDKNTGAYRVNSTQEDRNERTLKEIEEIGVHIDDLKKDIPKTILGRNDFPNQ